MLKAVPVGALLPIAHPEDARGGCIFVSYRVPEEPESYEKVPPIK